jgi:hypothetical protein
MLVQADLIPTTISSAPASVAPEPSPNSETPDPDQPFSADEGEAKTGDLLTPTAAYTAKPAYDRGREVLHKAIDLWKQRLALKSSDMALEAYDDLMEVRLGRRQKKARKKLREERHLAAEIYIESSIAYIKHDCEKKGSTTAAKLEARERLGDLRDVSREYLELQKAVVNAILELQ